jgi:hypothetical protein
VTKRRGRAYEAVGPPSSARDRSSVLSDNGPVFFVATVFVFSLITHLKFVLHNSFPIPYWDETGFIPYVTGSKPVSLDWLWSQANEHRIVLHRLFYLVFAKVFGLHAAIYNATSVTMLAATALAGLLVLRWITGKTRYTDAAIPLLLLHGGHYPNTLWPIQLGFVVAACSAMLAVLLIGVRTILPRERFTLLFGLLLLVSILCGGNGLLTTIAFVPLYIRHIVDSRSGVTVRWTWFGWVITSALLTLFLLYFVNYSRVSLAGRPFTPVDSIVEAFKALSMALGPYSRLLWPASGALMGLLTAGTLIWLMVAWGKDLHDRILIEGLIAGLASVIALAASVGHNRAVLGAGAGFAPHYATFFTPLIFIVYFAFRLLAINGSFFLFALFTATALWYFPNAISAETELRPRIEDGKALEKAVAAEQPIRTVAAEFGPRWMFTPEIASEDLHMLAKARMGIYGKYAPPPAGADNLQLLRENTELKGPGTSGQFLRLADYNLGQTYAVIAHVHHRATIPVPSRASSIHFGFGVLPDQVTGGVKFVLSLREPGQQPKELWNDVLRPPYVRSPEGVHRVDLALPLSVLGSSLVFETESPSDVVRNEGQWGFWTAIRFNVDSLK